MLDDAGTLRQGDRHPCHIDRKVPAIAGYVPVELVILLEEADLPRGAIADLVAVRRVLEEDVLAADPDARAVAERFEGIGLSPPVALHVEDVEADDHPLAIPVRIGRREVTEDAVPDLVAFGIDGDRLGDVDRGIGVHRHVADEALDALLGQRRGGQRQAEDQEGKKAAHLSAS